MNITISGGRGYDSEEISESQRAERHLWIDWTSGNLRLRGAAHKFLFDNDRDLESVCSRAGLNLTYLRDRLRRVRPPVLLTQPPRYFQKALY
jgi:hypothetical protein